MRTQTADSRPTARHMRPHVAAFVTRLTDRGRVPLDYTVDSLKVVDHIIDGLRRGSPAPDRVRGTLFDLGAYAGEVLVRRTGAQWVDLSSQHQRLFAQPVGIRMPDARVWNPVGKAVNRFEAGPPESLHTLYLLLHGRRPATAP
ncbi:hypothetical protein V1J52_06920 [Streptomyces sp. TRM 70351]|uniref:hypothetical protein n=1 Tax=Streptomyces sp. TRM 70351 TaxID=3116552 RepID=UPI002E7B7D12|nr:hypothetical protein [Streptomyces sp. TRM 70351]MEE1927927.1 hypothetical protein [Streptomyces sp. TRM 70351]